MTKETVQETLDRAKTFADVFGPIPPGDASARHALLRRSFKEMAKGAHPDLGGSDGSFRHLYDLMNAAKDAIDEDRYEAEIPVSLNVDSDRGVLNSSVGTYQLELVPTYRGDLSMIYRAQDLRSDRAVLVKIALTPTANAALSWEATLAGRSEPCLPQILDSFRMPSTGGTAFQVLVYAVRPGYVSLTEIMERYPNGLDPRDAAWICRRVLGQCVVAKSLGVVHGAIVPDHVLVHPLTHEPIHIGWAHARELHGEVAPRLTAVIDRWRGWYPPSVLARKPCTPTLDLEMAAKTMLALFGPEEAVPQELSKLLYDCARGKEGDARAVLSRFTDMIRRLWGRQYRPLAM